MHLPLDNLSHTDPSVLETSPSSLYLANPTGGTLSNLVRQINERTSLTLSPSGLSIIKVASKIDEAAHGISKANEVDIYIAYVGPYEADEARKLGSFQMFVRRTIGLFDEDGEEAARKAKSMLFSDLDPRLIKEGKIVHIHFNRRGPDFRIDYTLTRDQFKREILPRLGIDYEPPEKDKIFYGAGWGADAYRRIQSAMGIEVRDFFVPDHLIEEIPGKHNGLHL